MPIDYKRYPPNWKKEIVPRILNRAQNKCECCGLENGEIVWAPKWRGKVHGWFREYDVAITYKRSFESRSIKGKTIDIPNPKRVKVVLTIAHLDHDETNHEVSDDRLKAMCQLCHLRYDAKEKYLRRENLKPRP